MVEYSETVYIDVDLGDFDDKDLIEELESRGFYVGDEKQFIDIIHLWERGDKKEALIFLEREIPELRGISRLVD